MEQAWRATITTATVLRPTRRKLIQTDSIVSRWLKQRIKKRMSLFEPGRIHGTLTMSQRATVTVTSVPVRHKISSPLFVNQVPPPGVDTDPKAFCPALLYGEKVQGFITTTLGPSRTIIEPFSHDHQTVEQIRLRL